MQPSVEVTGAVKFENPSSMPEASPYACRRYFSQACDRQHVPLAECKILMGHCGTADMTRHYQGLADVERRRDYMEAVARELLG